jgi:hypothetical protein
VSCISEEFVYLFEIFRAGKRVGWPEEGCFGSIFTFVFF